MSTTTTSEHLSLSEQMQQGLRDMEARAKAAGSNMTQVCKNTGVARVTYERWKQRPPKTVQLYDTLEAEVSRLERDAAARATQGAAQ